MSHEFLVCRYIFNSKEYGFSMRSYWRHSQVKWFLLVVIVGIAAANIYGESHPVNTPGVPAEPVTVRTVVADFLPQALFFGVLILATYFAGRFAFRKGAYCNKEMIFTLRDSGVHVHSPLTETEMKWPIYASATESAYGFALFHQGKRAFNWLPMHGFAGPVEIDRCRELIRNNVKDSKRLVRL